ncbi:MAG: DUF3040 domain-containing protein [Pseudonocardia sp.]|nr:DUF3040 domain-containing protein [Pseudonocardia sp.]
MLNEPERRALDAIAQQMRTEDPEFCRAMDGAAGSELRWRRWLPAAAITSGVFGVAVAVLGVLAFSIGLVFFGGLLVAAGWVGWRLRKAEAAQRADGTRATGWTWRDRTG